MLAALPHLRAFSISLTGNVERADDLVQDTVVRALGFIDRFEPGHQPAGLDVHHPAQPVPFGLPKRKREVEDVDGMFAAKLTTIPDQDAHLEFEDFSQALATISPDQREAILLVGAEGFTYEEAAAICRTKVGTIKSRVNRARIACLNCSATTRWPISARMGSSRPRSAGSKPLLGGMRAPRRFGE
jgi:RNA polymerase sigma-70 factor (ECF subfamily)